MSESTVDATTDTDATDTESGSEAFDEARARDKIKKANAEARSLRERLKALEPLAAAAQEAEQAKLSTEERFAQQLKELSSRAEKAEARILRMSVARAAGLPDDLADRLQGDDEEALTADAGRLAELFGAKEPTEQSKPARRGDPSQGSDAMALNGDPLERSLRNAVGA